MKKLLALLLVVAMLALCACGAPAESAAASAPESVVASAPEAAPEAEASVPAEPVVEENVVDLAEAGSVTISEAGEITVTGATEEGQILVAAPGADVALTLDNVSVVSSGAPAIYVEDAASVTITLVGENAVADGDGYAEDAAVHAAVYAAVPVTFNGEGSLAVTSTHHGIEGAVALTFDGGTYDILTAGGSPEEVYEIEDETIPTPASIYSADTLTFNGGSFKTDSSFDGIIAVGLMTINGGALEVYCANDGVHSDSEVIINDGNVNVARSVEGLEAMHITVAGGDVKIHSVDDGINAAGGEEDDMAPGWDKESLLTVVPENSNHFMMFTGGTVEVDAQGDGLDSNGATFVTGGTVIVHGPTGFDNGALDYTSSGRIENGVVLACGSAGMPQNFDVASSQVSVLVTLEETVAAGSTVTITDKDGNVLMEHTMNKEFASVVFSCPELKVGQTYTLTCGELVTEVEVTDTLTTIGGFGMMMPPPMGMMPPMDGGMPPMDGGMPPMDGGMPPMGEMPPAP